MSGQQQSTPATPATPATSPAPSPLPPGSPGGRPRNGLGTSALVLGVVAASLSCTFVLSPAAAVLGVLAVILGVVGVRRARRGLATNRAAALGGLWTGVGAAVVGGALTVVLVVWVTQPVEVASQAGSAYLAEEGDAVSYEDGLVVVVAAPEPSPDGTAVTVTAEVTNDGDEPADLTGARLTAYADDVELDGEAVSRTGPEPGTLGAGETDTVAYTIALPDGTGELGLDYAPGADYDLSYWVLNLTGLGGQRHGGGDGAHDGPGVDA